MRLPYPLSKYLDHPHLRFTLIETSKLAATTMLSIHNIRFWPSNVCRLMADRILSPTCSQSDATCSLEATETVYVTVAPALMSMSSTDTAASETVTVYSEPASMSAPAVLTVTTHDSSASTTEVSSLGPIATRKFNTCTRHLRCDQSCLLTSSNSSDVSRLVW